MNAKASKSLASAPRPVMGWPHLPLGLAGAGGLLVLIGLFADPRQLGFSWLMAFMFFLSLALGALFMVLVHHLFDASWSVPIRRLLEHVACLLPWMALLFIPLALLAPKVYPWMSMTEPDHALRAKSAFLNPPFFYLRVLIYFALWSFLALRLRYWSLQQDHTGAAECTIRMRRLAAGGIILFAITLSLAAVDWVKSLQHQWFSTMYGVYYFAGSVWTLLATVYVLTRIFQRTGPLKDVVTPTLYYYLGSLFLAFTVFYAYIAFSQYFIIWNANMPEETFWYVLRERGSWWQIGLLMIFGHFFLPFLILLRIDNKLNLTLMIPLAAWAWLMHLVDLSFNIMPVLHPEGFLVHWMDLGCLALMAGVLSFLFLKSWASQAPYPLRDPRLKEALTHHEIPPEVVETATAHKGA